MDQLNFNQSYLSSIKMELLHQDCVCYITNYLNTVDTFQLKSTCKSINNNLNHSSIPHHYGLLALHKQNNIINLRYHTSSTTIILNYWRQFIFSSYQEMTDIPIDKHQLSCKHHSYCSFDYILSPDNINECINNITSITNNSNSFITTHFTHFSGVKYTIHLLVSTNIDIIEATVKLLQEGKFYYINFNDTNITTRMFVVEEYGLMLLSHILREFTIDEAILFKTLVQNDFNMSKTITELSN